MIERPPPPSAPLAWLSPSAFEVLRACRLHMSYSRSGNGATSPPTAYQLLGDACHRVLERLAASRRIMADDWEASMEEEFDRAIHEAAEALAQHPDASLVGPPATWPGFATRKARLHKACARLRALLQDAGSDAEFVCEQSMSALGGRLRGRPDLIVRESAHHWVIDYKTGPILEGATDSPKEGYVRQLRLYAVMEREASGSLPDHAWLVPLKGPLLEVAVAEPESRLVADELLDQLEAYNELAPGPQPASPSVEACGWCPHAGTCPDFWLACRADWAPRMLAVRGVVTQAQHTLIGGVTLFLDVRGGSVEHDRVSIRGISPSEHPGAGVLEPGRQVAIRGLRPLSEGGNTFALLRGATVWVLE